MKNTRTIINFILHRVLAFVLMLCLMLPMAADLVSPEMATVSAARMLKLSTAKSVSIAYSDKIESLELQIDGKESARVSAVRSIREKYRSNRTFRYTPLLNFKFPTAPDQAESFEFTYKPIQLQYEIDDLKHKVTDEKLKEYEKVSNIYIDIITSQAEIAFLNARIDSMTEAVAKNEARVALGEATQAQVDQQKQKLDGYKSSLATEQGKFQRAKEKLGKEVGFSVTTGYRFEEAFVTSSIDRDTIAYLQAYALDRDHAVFEAKQNEELARLALMTNYQLLKGQYGGDMSMISQYIQDAIDGNKINKRAFKKQYDAFLKKVDAPWAGSYKILFFSFPKEWFKGSIDGIRYVQDDPYVLYSNALDYESALKDYNNACDEVRSAVEEGYDTFIEARKNYIAAQKDINIRRNQLVVDEALNALGQLSLDEYETENSEYEDARSELKAALSTYSSTLYSYDRTTCGGLSAYLTEESLMSQAGIAGTGGLGAPEPGDDLERELADMSAIIKKGITYSIKDIVDSEEFMLYIDVPEDFDVDITHFELWSDGRQIGERVAVGDSIRHLRLTVEDVSTVFIRLYNGEEKVDDCSFDPSFNYGPLNLTVDHEDPVAPEQIIGTYTVDEDNTTDTIKMRFEFDQNAVQRLYQLGTPVYYYNMSAEQNLYLFSDELISADTPFQYMSFIKNDIGALTIRMFDEEGEYIGGAYFNTVTNTMYVDEDVTEADMQVLAARKLLEDEMASQLQKELDKLNDLLKAAQLAGNTNPDSATIEYYKKRVAELEEKIKNVKDLITDEDVQRALEERPEDVQEVMEKMRPSGQVLDENGDPIPSLSDQEKAARAQILETSAVDFIKNLRTDEMREKLQKEITDKEKQIADKNRKYREALQDGDDTLAARLKAEMEALQKEVDNAKKKKAVASGDVGEITPEEIENALKDFEDEIYASSVDQLSDAMLWGSPSGQWAKAYLESHGMEVTTENMRLVVGRAGNIETYEKMLVRKETLTKEVAEARQKLAKLKEGTTLTEKACAEQMEKMVAAYEKELETLAKDTKKTDPGSAIKANELRNKINALEKEIADSEAKIATLVCVINPDRDAYVGNELTSKRTAALAQYNAAVQEKEDALAEFGSEIQTYQAKIDIMNGEATITKESLTQKEKEYKTAIEAHQTIRDGYVKEKNEVDAGIREMKNSIWRRLYEAFGDMEYAENLSRNYANKIAGEDRDIEYLEKQLAGLRIMYQDVINASSSSSASTNYISENETMIKNSQARLETLTDECDMKIAAAKTTMDTAQAAYDEKAKAWNDSFAEQVRLEGIIEADKAQLPGLQAELLEYE